MHTFAVRIALDGMSLHPQPRALERVGSWPLDGPSGLFGAFTGSTAHPNACVRDLTLKFGELGKRRVSEGRLDALLTTQSAAQPHGCKRIAAE